MQGSGGPSMPVCAAPRSLLCIHFPLAPTQWPPTTGHPSPPFAS